MRRSLLVSSCCLMSIALFLHGDFSMAQGPSSVGVNSKVTRHRVGGGRAAEAW